MVPSARRTLMRLPLAVKDHERIRAQEGVPGHFSPPSTDSSRKA
jgi:hypothetical protein